MILLWSLSFLHLRSSSCGFFRLLFWSLFVIYFSFSCLLSDLSVSLFHLLLSICLSVLCVSSFPVIVLCSTPCISLSATDPFVYCPFCLCSRNRPFISSLFRLCFPRSAVIFSFSWCVSSISDYIFLLLVFCFPLPPWLFVFIFDFRFR